MNEKSDTQLLRDYAERRDESAFREIVGRYTDLVYSAALRQVESSAAASDIAQGVFTDLARKAGGLVRHGGAVPPPSLAGWLHRATRYAALNYLRDARRRFTNERQAMEQLLTNSQSDASWEQVRPALDEALDSLGDDDREALLLRYFKNQDFRAVGLALGLSDDAAQKRVSRAVEKLRGHFVQRGIVISSLAITSIISAQAVHAAPVGLASSIAAASLAGAVSVSYATTVTQTILMKKSALIVVTLLLFSAAIVTPITIAKIKQARANAPVTEKSLKDGLVLHLTFDHDETGSRITDSSGKRNSVRATGVRWVAEGRNGGAYEFAHDGDEIVVANNKSLNPQQLTLSAWIKTANSDAIWRRIFDKSYSKGYALSIAGDWEKNKWRGLASLEIGPGTHFILTKQIVADGNWHQIVATCDGSSEWLYVDGQPAGQMRWKNPGQVGGTDFDLVIGCNRSNVGEYDAGTSFRGMIDEPMMWDRSLSAKEVAFLFASQNGSPASSIAAN